MAKYVVTGDNHLCFALPVCRMDEDWIGFQQKALLNIISVANTHEADLIITGDLFDSPIVHPAIVGMFLETMNALLGTVHIIAGNHSLPAHREAQADMGSIGIIKAIAGENDGHIRYYTCNEETIEGRFEHSHKFSDDITLVHTLTFENDIPYGAKAVTAEYLLDKYPTPWIFIGDMHKNFVYKENDRRVVNPGCMTIQSAGELDYVPGVYLVETGERIDTSTGKTVSYRMQGASVDFIPIVNDVTVLTRNHLEDKQKRDERISAFLEIIQVGKELNLSFLDTLAQTLVATKTSTEVDEIFRELKEENDGISG